MSFDLKQIIGSVAPMLATALGGPLAGMAVKAIAGAVLGPDEVSAAQGNENPIEALKTRVETAISNGVADMSKLKQAEDDFKLKMAELGYKNVTDLAAIDAGDRDSARKREIAVKDHTPQIMAYLVTLGFFGVLGMLFYGGKPDTGGDVLLVMLGSLGTAWTARISYFYGSSSSSKTKDATISSLAK